MTDDDGSEDNRYGFARQALSADSLQQAPMPEERKRSEALGPEELVGSEPLGNEKAGLMSRGEDREQKLWFALGLAGFVYVIGIIGSWSFYQKLDVIP